MSAVTETATRTAPSFFQSIGNHFSAGLSSTYNAISPALKFVATQVQKVWNFCLPHLQAAGRFMTSSVVFSLGVVGLSVVPLIIAKNTDNRWLSAACIASGVALAVTGGVLLHSSGALSFMARVIPSAAAV